MDGPLNNSKCLRSRILPIKLLFSFSLTSHLPLTYSVISDSLEMYVLEFCGKHRGSRECGSKETQGRVWSLSDHSDKSLSASVSSPGRWCLSYLSHRIARGIHQIKKIKPLAYNPIQPMIHICRVTAIPPPSCFRPYHIYTSNSYLFMYLFN